MKEKKYKKKDRFRRESGNGLEYESRGRRGISRSRGGL